MIAEHAAPPPPTPAPVPAPIIAQVPAASAVATIDRILVAARPTIVRAGAGDTAPRLGQLATDATVQATGRSQIGAASWYRVSFQGREGWVAAPTMREIDPAEVAAWSHLRGSRDAPAYEDFLRSYPRGYYAERARQSLVAMRDQGAPRDQGRGQNVPPPAAINQPQVASRPPAGASARGCYRVGRSGGNYIRFCFDGNAGSREETVSSAGNGYTNSALSVSTIRDTCRAPLSVMGGGDDLRISWPIAMCGQNTTSAGSASCRLAGDGSVLTCGGESYRRE
jgi:hypothetical protein